VAFQNWLLVPIRWSISSATRGRGVRFVTSTPNADAAGRPAAHPEPLMARSEVSQSPMTGARKEPDVSVELDTRQDADDMVSLEWDRDTGDSQIVGADIRDESLLVFPVPGANAGQAFRHPFRYAQ